MREGWKVNHKRVYRLYVEEKLSLRRKRGRADVRDGLVNRRAAPQLQSSVDDGLHQRCAHRRAQVSDL